MSRLRIRHRTGFSYAGEVTASYNEARMLPASGDGQLVLYSHLDISPVTNAHNYVDYWGTRVSSFEVLSPHRELSLTATSVVEVRPRRQPAEPLGWAELAAAVETSTEYIDQLGQTGRTRPPAEVQELARSVAGRSASPAEAALAICTEVGQAVEYMPGVTGVSTTAAEAWEHRRGVCQDITHLALGALRSVGIPARYVSGYLHPRADAEVGETVTGESHAWVEWFAGSWRGFDPTNAIDIGERHVMVGRGRDYSDVAPLRGVYDGPHSSHLFVSVEITREA